MIWLKLAKIVVIFKQLKVGRLHTKWTRFVFIFSPNDGIFCRVKKPHIDGQAGPHFDEKPPSFGPPSF